MDSVSEIVRDVEWISVEHESAPGRVRRAATELAHRLGFDEHRRGEVAVAISELATNVYRHAVAGTSLLRVRSQGDASAVEAVFVDSGPGVADLDTISRDGYSSRGTLGVGIGAAMRMASTYDCYSAPGKGTVTAVTFWDDGIGKPDQPVQGITRSMNGETRCGDAWSSLTDGAVTRIMLADGLGHGELAAIASSAAVDAFCETKSTSASEIMQSINSALRSTRGAAAAVIVLDKTTSTATFSGIGNVGVWLDNLKGRKGLASVPGIAGTYAKPTREIAVEIDRHTTVVMHSDGLTSKWDLSNYPGLRGRNALLVAATLLRDAGVHQDDASVVVTRTS